MVAPMPDPQASLKVVASVCLIAGMVLMVFPASDLGPLRYFAGAILIGLALLVFIFGPRTF